MLRVILKNLKKELYLYLVWYIDHRTKDEGRSWVRSLSTVIKDRYCIITGDFTCPKVNWKDRTADVEGRWLLDFVSEELLIQWINETTQGNSVKDLVFSSKDDMISNLTVLEKLK